MTDQPITMQPRCPACLTELYCLTVVAFSYGETPCHTCGHISQPMTHAQYRTAVTQARDAWHQRKTAQ